MICPNCKEHIINVNFQAFGKYDGVEYDYEESETIYTCPECDVELDCEEVMNL